MKKILFALLVIFPLSANAERLNIDITSGNFQPIPVAVHGFVAGDGLSDEANRVLVSVINNDLAGTGLFKLISPNSFLERLTSGQVVPTFESWSQIGAQALVSGSIKKSGGKFVIEFRLWDVLTSSQMAGTSYTTSERGLRRVGHQIADEIYTRLTGEGAYFDSRIVYVAESGPKNRRVKRLAIMDQDGHNHQYITGGRSLVLTPRFTPTDQKIIYMSYANGVPRVRTLDIETGRESTVGDFPGMTFAPRYSPNGRNLLISVAQGGNTEIYEVGSGKRRLTNDPAIDTSASYSPNGNNIVFSSDRGGSQQLYVMDSSGGNVKRISFGGGNYSSPVWSPRGDFIAFTKQTGGTFHIGVIKPDGSGERLLTGSYMDENPSWSPNGRVIVFTREARRGKSGLYAVDVTGQNERRIPTPGEASDATWSPLLK
jgi:TolB protein